MNYIDRWKIAYEKANGKPAPLVSISRGWIKIDGMKHGFRYRDFFAVAEELERRANESQSTDKQKATGSNEL